MNHSTPGLPVHQNPPKLMSIQSVMPSNHLILCLPHLLLPPIPSSIRVFSNESTLCMRWPKYWSFSFSNSASNEHPGLISFRMDWLDLLAVQGTLKSLLQHHSSKALIFWCPAFFTIQLSHPYMTAGKIIALSRWTFVSKVISLLLNMLSRLVITFLPMSQFFAFRWPKYWSFSFSISPSNEHPGLMSFRMDWLDLLAVQGTLKSLLQHHNSKASILQRSAFFTVQLSHPYMTTGKTIALTRWIFVGKVMSLLFNVLEGPQSNMVIRFLDSWRQSIYPLRFQSSTVKDTKKGARKWNKENKQPINQLRKQHYRTMT